MRFRLISANKQTKTLLRYKANAKAEMASAFAFFLVLLFYVSFVTIKCDLTNNCAVENMGNAVQLGNNNDV